MVKRVFPYQNHLQMCNRAIRKDTALIHFPFSILHFQFLSRKRKPPEIFSGGFLFISLLRLLP